MYKSEWNKLDQDQKKEIKRIFERGIDVEEKIFWYVSREFFFSETEFCNEQGMSDQGFVNWVIGRLKLDLRRKKIDKIRRRSSDFNDYDIF